MKKEVWRHLPKTELTSYHHWLVRLVTRLDDPVGGTHADWEEARTDHDGIQVSGASVIGKAV
jgi:hypothetical protein